MNKLNKQVHIFGGGTFSYVRTHLALAAPAFGSTARSIVNLFESEVKYRNLTAVLHLTKMADASSKLVTNDNVAERVKEVIANPLTKIVFFNVAMVDFEGTLGISNSGKYEPRLGSDSNYLMDLRPTAKVVNSIRKTRKDIFLVSFKTTSGASREEMYLKGLKLLKTSSSNLVLVNDVKTCWNMVITPEEAAYHETQDRDEVLAGLVEMAWLRSHLTFTQSTVVAGEAVPWNSPEVPSSLRNVVDYCISRRAYKPFNNSTVGHFAVKVNDNTFLTSIRKSNFNDLDKVGLVKVVTDGPDTVIAYGAKPSVGGQSQRRVFREHEGMDCIVHFHSPLKSDAPDAIPIRSQREVECGSHECGKNTSSGLAQFGNLKAVYLDRHGPNIVFNRDIDPQEVINFIDRNFELEKKTGGYNLI